MRHFVRFLLAFAVLSFFSFSTHPALAANKIALVIGNDEYLNLPSLERAGNDARAMADSLRDMDYEVIFATDVTRSELIARIQELDLKMRTGDIVVLFYAGHGVEIDGRNYLIPVDMPSVRAGQSLTVVEEGFPADRMLEVARLHGAQVTVMILDACRNNPFNADGRHRAIGRSRGLAAVAGAEGTFVMYSAGDGQTALDRLTDDDPDPNSVYTRHLLRLMERPGLPITRLARTLRREVVEDARTVAHEQRPAYYDEILGDFVFREPLVIASDGPTRVGRSSGEPDEEGTLVSNVSAEERLFWQSIENSSVTAPFSIYLSIYPEGAYSNEAREKIEQLGQTDHGALAPRSPIRSLIGTAHASDGVEHGWIADSEADTSTTRGRASVFRTRARRTMFPDSSSRALNDDRLRNLSCLDLWLARNEIYHRHGFCFTSRLGIQYFGNENCRTTSTGVVSPREQSNINRIKAWEQKKGC